MRGVVRSQTSASSPAWMFSGGGKTKLQKSDKPGVIRPAGPRSCGLSRLGSYSWHVGAGCESGFDSVEGKSWS
jgi:hypothetical protein